MLFALLTLLTAVQTQAAAPEPAQPVIGSPVISAPAEPAESGADPAPPVGNTSVAADERPSEPEPEAEPELPTRQVCRYVEVTGQRFPVRTCRTVTIEPG